MHAYVDVFIKLFVCFDDLQLYLKESVQNITLPVPAVHECVGWQIVYIDLNFMKSLSFCTYLHKVLSSRSR